MSATTGWHRPAPVSGHRLLSAPFIFFGVLAVLGVSLSIARLVTGLWFTGMNDDYAWGVWKTFNVMTLTALGSAGLAVGFFCYVLGKTHLAPVMRTAVASSILFYATGMFALCIDVGRPWNMYHILLPWNWNLHSSLFEVALCMTAYVVFFLSFENIPTVIEKWKGYAKWRPWLLRLMPFVIGGALVLPAMHQSSLGSLMVIAGHKVHPLWQTQMLPAFYLIQAVVCGFAAILFILMSADLAWRRALDMKILSSMGKYMAWTSVVFVVLRYVDLVWRGQLATAFAFDRYSLLFTLENLLVFVPALILFSERMRMTPRMLFVCALFTGAGGILYRFTPTTIAYRANHPSVYFPKIAELIMCLGYIGLAVVLFIAAAKRFAILPERTQHGSATGH